MAEIVSAHIEFTKSEADLLLNMVDLALKSEGLKIAGTAFYLSEKIKSAFIPKPIEGDNHG